MWEPSRPAEYFSVGLLDGDKLRPKALREWAVMGATHLYDRGVRPDEIERVLGMLQYRWSKRKDDTEDSMMDIREMLRSLSYMYASPDLNEFISCAFGYHGTVIEIDAFLLHMRHVANNMEILHQAHEAAAAKDTGKKS
jgi:hypothetical protein